MDVVHVDVGTNRDGAEVCWDGVVKSPSRQQRVTTQRNLFDEMSLVVRATTVRTSNVVGVRRPFHEVVKARVPHSTKIWRNCREPNAEVVNQITRVVHASPIRITPGLPPVPNDERYTLALLHWSGRIEMQLRLLMIKTNSNTIPMHAVDDQRLQVPPHRGSTPLQHREINGGNAANGLSCIIRHIEREVVMNNIKTVASRDARPHVKILRDKKGPGGWRDLCAAQGMATLCQKWIPHHLAFFVKTWQGGLRT